MVLKSTTQSLVEKGNVLFNIKSPMWLGNILESHPKSGIVHNRRSVKGSFDCWSLGSRNPKGFLLPLQLYSSNAMICCVAKAEVRENLRSSAGSIEALWDGDIVDPRCMDTIRMSPSNMFIIMYCTSGRETERLLFQKMAKVFRVGVASIIMLKNHEVVSRTSKGIRINEKLLRCISTMTKKKRIEVFPPKSAICL